MDVNVGSIHDPKHLPGLAHYLEHMLFLGTEKYPDETEYNQYVKSHGGSQNAYTDQYYTNYHFSISPDYLEGAVDRFSQFFLTPLFSKSAADREINAVDSEFNLRRVEDFRRRYHLWHSTANPEHPHCNFSMGNLETLKTVPESKNIDVRAALLDFHKKWYSSNIMRLVILGKESLDDLQNMVQKKFSDVVDRNVIVPEPGRVAGDVPPFTPRQLKKQLHIVPIQDVQELIFLFPLPPQTRNWRCKPAGCLSHMIGHEGRGSLLSALKKEGLATGLCASSMNDESCCFFIVQISMTPQGAEKKGVDRIGDLVFLYLELLRSNMIQEWLFDELRALADVGFRFREMEEPYDFCRDHAKNLHHYPPELVMGANELFHEFIPEEFRKVLDLLTVENCIMEIDDKKHEAICTSKEYYFGTQYLHEDLDATRADRWSKIQSRSAEETAAAALKEGLRYPEPNLFIPRDITVKPLEVPKASKDAPPRIPERLVFPPDSPAYNKSLVHFKQDDSFFVPKLSVNLHISLPFMAESLRNWMIGRLFFGTVDESLCETLYDAQLAGLSLELSAEVPGEVFIKAYGFSCKLLTLLTFCTEKVGAGGASLIPEHFATVYEMFSKRLANAITYDAAYAQTYRKFDEALVSPYYTLKDQFEMLKTISFEDVQALLASDLLTRGFVEGLIVGNAVSDDARNIVTSIICSLGIKEAAESAKLVERKVVDLSEGGALPGARYRFTALNTNSNDPNNVTMVRLQMGDLPFKDRCITRLVVHCISQPFFDMLRTEQQLGYVVQAYNTMMSQTSGIRLYPCVCCAISM
eukprot:GHVT01082748.1.p1 GENE.GHVT01082748.1~~GHVT01082748.1.p1  ORF type:complete len:919 (+),score=103.84 GHVT01082748.1:336-2759(+)